MISKKIPKLFLALSLCIICLSGYFGGLWQSIFIVLSPRLTLEPTPSIGELIPKFSSADIETRYQALYTAGYYYDDPDKARLIPYLVAALQENDKTWNGHRVREYSAQSLGNLEVYDPRMIEILTSWLDEPRQPGAELLQGIQTLGKFSEHAANATPGLIRIISDPDQSDDHVQAAAMATLSAIGDPAAVPYLFKVFVSSAEPAWVRKIAGIALAKYGRASVCGVPYLTTELDSPEPDVSIAAALILSQATDNVFPNSQRQNWDPDLGASWIFDKNENQEYQIVAAAKNWWRETGQTMPWPLCKHGLDGIPAFP